MASLAVWNCSFVDIFEISANLFPPKYNIYDFAGGNIDADTVNVGDDTDDVDDTDADLFLVMLLMVMLI